MMLIIKQLEKVDHLPDLTAWMSIYGRKLKHVKSCENQSSLIRMIKLQIFSLVHVCQEKKQREPRSSVCNITVLMYTRGPWALTLCLRTNSAMGLLYTLKL